MGPCCRRRELLLAGALAPWSVEPLAAVATKTLRTAFDFAETGFDPPRISDNSSAQVNAHIFEAPLTYDPLANPPRLVPLTAAALPEMLDGARRFVFTLKPGTLFADDPAFRGQPRELVAADYVYSIKRYADPALKSEHVYHFENAGLLGLAALRRRALKDKAPFDYDTPIEGLRALDRYRFEVRTTEPQPRLPYVFAQAGLAGAVAREVVQAYGDDILAHPVGTGPFRLAQWRRGSRIVLERNPRFRELRYHGEPPPDQTDLVALAARLNGQRLPFLDRIEIAIIEESQPRWLAFLRGELDLLTLPSDFSPLAMPNGQLAPYLAKRGVRARRDLTPSVFFTFFNCDDTIVGGYRAEQVALRRAIALAYDNALENRHAHGDAHVAAHSLVAPHCYGYDPGLLSGTGSGQVARANALLDTWGYTERDNGGWRKTPDGKPIVLRRAFAPSQRSRRIAEVWQKQMQAIGLRLEAEFAPFGELIKRSLAGQLMMWGFGWSMPSPDADFSLGLAYGPNADQANDARFKLPAYDRLYERQRALPDGTDRLKLVREANRHLFSYMPYIPHYHAVVVNLTQPHVLNYFRHPFATDRWKALDLAPSSV